MRSLKQAESEDCDQVDIEHFEKILPQLVSCRPKNYIANINIFKYRAFPVFTEPVFIFKLLIVFESVFFKLSKFN